MLRKYIPLVGLAFGFLIAGCTSAIDPATITQIQNQALAICGILPAAEAVSEIWISGNVAATAAAGKIEESAAIACKVLAASIPAAPAGPSVAPTAAGIPVQAKWGGVVLHGTYFPAMMGH